MRHRGRVGTQIAILLIIMAGVITLWLQGPPPRGLLRFWLRHRFQTDEQQLQALVAEAREAVMRHQVSRLTRLISQDYFDSYGTTRSELVRLLVQWGRSGEEIFVAPEISSLQLKLPFAEMSVRVWLWRGSEPTENGELYQLHIRWRKEGRHWRVISADGWAAPQHENGDLP